MNSSTRLIRSRHQQQAFSERPETIVFTTIHLTAMTDLIEEQHDWGQLAYIRHGLMELKVAGTDFIAPPGFAVWIPPLTLHRSYNHKPLDFGTINVAAKLCGPLPDQACVISLTPLLQAIIDDVRQRNVQTPLSEADHRLAQVVLDQLILAPKQQRYLPISEDRLLAPILRQLEANPADNRALADWARLVHSSERTLSRRCNEQLGMSFSEWRQRLRFIQSLSMLEQGLSIKEISLELGYSTPSSFITMFQALAGITPERHRKGQQQSQKPAQE